MNTAAKNCAATLVGLLILVLADLSLILFGVEPLSREDPFVGFQGSQPLYLKSGKAGQLYTLNPAKERYFNPQSFRMPKPDGTFRIFSFGGSTTYGRPYIHRTSFPFWVGALLDRSDGKRTYESLNAGGISYASYRVLRLVSELSRFAPDLYVVYSGHNEFLEARTFANIIDEPPLLRKTRSLLHHSRLYALLARAVRKVRGEGVQTRKTVFGDEVEARIEEVGGPELYRRDALFREGVIRQYRYNIEQIVRHCRKKKINLILCTLPSNLSGMSPFKSEHRDGLSQEKLKEWNGFFLSAREAFLAADYGRALELMEAAERIDDRYALLHYARGLTLEKTGDYVEAERAFVRAKEEDIVPLRALEAFNGILREVAAREGVPLADIERKFRKTSPKGIPGPSLFADHVHPTLEAQQLMAATIVDTAVEAGIVPLSRAEWQAKAEEAKGDIAARLRSLPPRYRAMGLWGVGRLFHWAGKYREAYGPLVEAWKVVRDIEEIPRHLGDIVLREGRPGEALAFYQEALRLEPGNTDSLLGVARAYLELGMASEVIDITSKISPTPGKEALLYSLKGEAELLAGELAAALGSLKAAVAASPEVPRFHYLLAKAFIMGGSEEDARERFRIYLDLSGRGWSEAEFERFRKEAGP